MRTNEMCSIPHHRLSSFAVAKHNTRTMIPGTGNLDVSPRIDGIKCTTRRFNVNAVEGQVDQPQLSQTGVVQMLFYRVSKSLQGNHGKIKPVE